MSSPGTFSRFTPRPSSAPGRPREHVLAVGSRATVKAHGTAAVSLTDSLGIRQVATVPHGAEVEIVAWLPVGRGGGARYRVLYRRAEGCDGWVAAGELVAVVTPAPARSVLPAQPVPAARKVTAKPSRRRG